MARALLFLVTSVDGETQRAGNTAKTRHGFGRRLVPPCVAFLSDADEAEVRDLTAIARRKVLRAGQTHVMEGDRARNFANVVSGVAKLVSGSADGRSQIVGLLFPRDFIGGALGNTEVPREPHSIEAVSDLELCLYPRDAFEQLLHVHPALEERLLKCALCELQTAREWLVLLGRKTASERVASFIVYVMQKLKVDAGDGTASFDLPLSRSEIADFVGLTIETVSRQMSSLKKDGIIEMDGPKHVVALDEDRLRARAGF